MEWYYADNQQQIGPIDDDEFRHLVNSATIVDQTLVWNSDMSDWQAYGKLVAAQSGGQDGASSLMAAPKINCAECGRSFAKDDMIQYKESWVCAACKPVFIQKLREGVSVNTNLAYGGFWIRFGAKMIDILIVGAIQMAIFVPGMIFMAPSLAQTEGQPPNLAGLFAIQGLAFLMQVAYPTFFVGKFAATPGKMACRLKVATADGGRVSYPRALGRHFAEMISGMILMVGYLMAAFDGQKRALHDHICSTRVVHK